MAKGRTQGGEFHRMVSWPVEGQHEESLKNSNWKCGSVVQFAWHSEGLGLESATPNTDAGLRGGKGKGAKVQ